MMNKKIGNDFEQELCELLADNGFWVHNFANRKNGQPADIIAVKGGIAFLIDAKICSNNVFRFSRIEENQRYAMQAWESCGNTNPYFALHANGRIYMLSFEMVKILEADGTKQLNAEEIDEYCIVLSTWLKIVNVSI